MIKIFADILLIDASFILAYFLRFKIVLFVAPTSMPVFEQYFRIIVFVTVLWMAIFKLVGIYDEKKNSNLLDELALLFWGVTLSSLVLVGLLFLYRELWFSRLVVANAWWLAIVLLSSYRIILSIVAHLLKKHGFFLKSVLIIGAGEVGQLLPYKFSSQGMYGYKFIGYLDDDAQKQGQVFNGLKVLGKVEVSNLKKLIVEHKIQEVIITTSKISDERILDIITESERFNLEFKIVPGMLELIATRLDVDEMGGLPLLSVSSIQLQGFKAFIKRITDIILSLLGIIFISPILLIFGLLVKITSKGPIFFVQSRVGMDGKLFPMLKFRSMVWDAEQRLSNILHLSEAEGHLFKMKKDPRMTPLGIFMRRFSIDELPQLFNCLWGHMSLVGPRPPLQREVEKYNSWHKKRLRVRPGITGLWQVSGRSLLPFEEMVRLDIYYIENWSLWLDIKILIQTISVVLFAIGAF